MNNTYKDSDLKKLKKLELMIFEDFIAICENHNIDYYISSGTALGAVRHGGFIPWDDDIDIAVFRKDYEKLLTILDEELSSKYYVIALEKQDDCFFPFEVKFHLMKEFSLIYFLWIKFQRVGFQG